MRLRYFAAVSKQLLRLYSIKYSSSTEAERKKAWREILSKLFLEKYYYVPWYNNILFGCHRRL